MAKVTKKEKEEVVLEEVTPIVFTENIVTPEEVTIEATTESRKQKLVRIRVKDKFKCYIGEWYYFEKNKVYSVPEHVKEHLLQRGKLLPM